MPRTATDTVKKIRGPKPKFGRFILVPDSKMVEKVFYDPATKVMDAVFRRSGSRYRYFRVHPKTFAEFVVADSMGKYFNQNIRSNHNFGCQKLGPDLGNYGSKPN